MFYIIYIRGCNKNTAAIFAILSSYLKQSKIARVPFSAFLFYKNYDKNKMLLFVKIAYKNKLTKLIYTIYFYVSSPNIFCGTR